MSNGQYFGKYRGTVRNNVDPELKGKIQVEVADVGGNTLLSWAMPCLPVAGTNMGIFTVPPVGAGVWVEFERGDVDQPIWVGGFFSEADVPVLARAVPPGVSGITLQTLAGTGIVLSDAPGVGGILLKTASGAMLHINETGITITTGSGLIKMTGPTVDVNGGALTVT